MARFANMPEPEYREDREFVKAAKVTSHFDASRYEVKPIDTEKMPLLYSQRGLSSETVKDLSPYLVLLRDKQNDKFDGYNVAFPYTDKDDKVKGYEIRGLGGYKSKAAGTDSSSSAWVADLSGGNREAVTSVFFFESAFDAMAFYQSIRRNWIRIPHWFLSVARSRMVRLLGQWHASPMRKPLTALTTTLPDVSMACA